MAPAQLRPCSVTLSGSHATAEHEEALRKRLKIHGRLSRLRFYYIADRKPFAEADFQTRKAASAAARQHRFVLQGPFRGWEVDNVIHVDTVHQRGLGHEIFTDPAYLTPTEEYEYDEFHNPTLVSKVFVPETEITRTPQTFVSNSLSRPSAPPLRVLSVKAKLKRSFNTRIAPCVVSRVDASDADETPSKRPRTTATNTPRPRSLPRVRSLRGTGHGIRRRRSSKGAMPPPYTVTSPALALTSSSSSSAASSVAPPTAGTQTGESGPDVLRNEIGRNTELVNMAIAACAGGALVSLYHALM